MKVIIIGAGIGGPILAMLLKHKGFDPIVYEKQHRSPMGGWTMQLTAQTFKVMSILGLGEQTLALTRPMDRVIHISQASGKTLLDGELYHQAIEKTGWPFCCIVRSTFAKFVLSNMAERGIPLHWGKKLVDVKQEGDKAIAIFEDGSTDEGDLLVACDGLHSRVRDVVFGKTEAEYTGLVAIGGFSPFSDDLPPPTPARQLQVSGELKNFVCMPTAEGKYIWVVNIPQKAEMPEDWRYTGPANKDEIQDCLPGEDWLGNAAAISHKAPEVIRFGMYLRPISPVWHKGRVVLLGDSAHPATPFLGQGANQSCEDIYHLVRALVKHQPLTNERLDEALKEYTAIRLPRATKAINQSKVERDYRLMTGEDLKKRDEIQGKGFESATWKVVWEMVQTGPFTGESEI